MAAPKLNAEQKNQLLVWLAAEYSEPLIRRWFMANDWPILDPSAITYYRNRWADEIAAARAQRREAALNQGLALKAERVRRLAEHADELDALKWVPDENGRYSNEKAWRETLDDIAKEMGERRPDIEGKLVEFLDQLQHVLSPKDYARALAYFASGQAGAGEAGR